MAFERNDLADFPEGHRVQYTSYVVKDSRDSLCKALHASSKSVSGRDASEVPEHIQQNLNKTSATQFILAPSDSFKFDGFQCSIYELYGPNVERVAGATQMSARRTRNVLRDWLEALDFLHSSGIVHGDVREWSGIHTYPKLDPKDDVAVKQFYGFSGAPDDTMVEPFDALFKGFSGKDIDRDFRLKLQNLRQAFHIDQVPTSADAYLGTACPPLEVLADKQLSEKMDIWYFGIVMTNLVACAPGWLTLMGDRSNDREKQFAICEKLLGPLPERYASLSASIEVLNGYSGRKDLLSEILGIRNDIARVDTVTSIQDENSRDLFCRESLDQAADVLKGLLAYEPEKRLTAKQALGYKFFQQDKQ